jgi:hypothetical protein
MSWKPIPNEEPAKIVFKKTHISPRFTLHPIYGKKNTINDTLSYRLYQSVSMRLLEYARKGGKYTLKEVADLITDMQKTILNLQKKRVNLCDKQKNKIKKPSK